MPRNSDFEAAYEVDAENKMKCRSGERKSIDAEHLSVHSVGIRNSKPPQLLAAKPPHFSSRKIAKTAKRHGWNGGLRDGRILPLHSLPRPSPDPVD